MTVHIYYSVDIITKLIEFVFVCFFFFVFSRSIVTSVVILFVPGIYLIIQHKNVNAYRGMLYPILTYVLIKDNITFYLKLRKRDIELETFNSKVNIDNE